jgi:hypothetical protein
MYLDFIVRGDGERERENGVTLCDPRSFRCITPVFIPQCKYRFICSLNGRAYMVRSLVYRTKEMSDETRV